MPQSLGPIWAPWPPSVCLSVCLPVWAPYSFWHLLSTVGVPEVLFECACKVFLSFGGSKGWQKSVFLGVWKERETGRSGKCEKCAKKKCDLHISQIQSAKQAQRKCGKGPTALKQCGKSCSLDCAAPSNQFEARFCNCPHYVVSKELNINK